MTAPHFVARTCPTCKGRKYWEAPDDAGHYQPCPDCPDLPGYQVDPAIVPMVPCCDSKRSCADSSRPGCAWGDPGTGQRPDPDWLALDQGCACDVGTDDHDPECAWCVDGRRTIPIYLPCDVCSGEPSHLWGAVCTRCGEYPHGAEGSGRNTGRILVGRASVTLAPVMNGMASRSAMDRIADYIAIYDDGVFHHYKDGDYWTYDPITLPSDVAPGDLVAIPDRIEAL